MPVQIMSGKAFCLVAVRVSGRASGHTGCDGGLPPFLLSPLPPLSFPRPRPSTTSCIKSAFSRRHDEGASDWTVGQVKVSVKFVNCSRLNSKSYQSKFWTGKWRSTLHGSRLSKSDVGVKKVQRHYETKRKRRKEGRKKADKFRKTMQSWCRDGQGRRGEGGGNGKSSGELLHYLVPPC